MLYIFILYIVIRQLEWDVTVVGAFLFLYARRCIIYCIEVFFVSCSEKNYKWILTHCMHEIDAGGLNCGFNKFHQKTSRSNMYTATNIEKLGWKARITTKSNSCLDNKIDVLLHFSVINNRKLLCMHFFSEYINVYVCIILEKHIRLKTSCISLQST